MLSKLKKTLRGLVGHDSDKFIGKCRGVIHVGANSGQEREYYATRGLNVVWIEALPDLFKELVTNIQPFEKQQALNALVTDVDGEEHLFNVASNEGASSSIYAMKDHSELWPEISYVGQVRLQSCTLASLIRKHAIDLKLYDALVLDVQGAEMLVLRGAGAYLNSFRFVKTEVADFEAYSGACTLEGLTDFMKRAGYASVQRTKFREKRGVGAYYDVLFERAQEK